MDLGLFNELKRLEALLIRIDSPFAAVIEDILALAARDETAAWKALNSNGIWAGAGSLAAETMADNPGLPDEVWRSEIREFREVLTDIGRRLMGRGGENPGISSWLSAFQHWNSAGV